MFKKYILNFGCFEFFSPCPFDELDFTDSMYLCNYLINSGEVDRSSVDPILFESKEDALKRLSEERTCVTQTASLVGYHFDVELPYLEEWDCFEDIHQYDPEAFGTGRLIATADF